MNSSAQFRFLLDYVEDVARRTPSVLYGESKHFWDDILEACSERDEKYNYWIFCTRWIRETLMEVMDRGTPRALQSIMNALGPSRVTNEDLAAMSKRQTMAQLLPILMVETLTKVNAAAALRSGPKFEDAPPSYHPGEL